MTTHLITSMTTITIINTQVICTKIDHVQGSIKLSRKQLLRKQQYVQDSEIDRYQDFEFNNIEADNLLDKNHHLKSNDDAEEGEEGDKQEYDYDDNDEYDNEKSDDGDNEYEDPNETEEDYLESLTVPELKEKLRLLGLPVSGVKAALIKRLLDDYDEQH